MERLCCGKVISSTRVGHWHLSKLVLVVLAFTLPTACTKYIPFIPNSFNFDYNQPGVSPPFPVTEQCQKINITWGPHQDLSEIGPPPVAPYFLHVHTSNFIVPFVIPAGNGPSFQWAVPFVPGTLYQVCMFDSVGNSGACEAIYAVIASSATTTPPSCPNVTFPAGAMDVLSLAVDGQLSQYGWLPQCTDIAITPRNGTPPYILTIAPPLRPIYIIKSDTMATINWTVSLGRSVPFFVSLIDSIGNSWAFGPLHSGKGVQTAQCLGISTPPIPKSGLIGSSVGGVVLGGILTYLFVLLLRGRSSNRGHPSPTAAAYYPVPNTGLSSTANPVLQGAEYHIEPFLLSDDQGDHPRRSASQDGAAEPLQRVYVIHRDSGPAPVVASSPSEEAAEGGAPPDYAESSGVAKPPYAQV